MNPNTKSLHGGFWCCSIQFLPFSCTARFPQSDLKIIASSDSLEVQACRPIKTHASLSFSFVFPSVTRFIGPAFSLKNLDPVNHQGGREEQKHSLEGELVAAIPGNIGGSLGIPWGDGVFRFVRGQPDQI